MSYVAAAYGIVVVTLAGYALYLARERRALRRALGDTLTRGATPAKPGRDLDERGRSEI